MSTGTLTRVQPASMGRFIVQLSSCDRHNSAFTGIAKAESIRATRPNLSKLANAFILVPKCFSENPPLMSIRVKTACLVPGLCVRMLLNVRFPPAEDAEHAEGSFEPLIER